MNKIKVNTEATPKDQTYADGDLFEERDGAVYILYEYDDDWTLVSLGDGMTYNGRCKNIDELGCDSAFGDDREEFTKLPKGSKITIEVQ